MRAKCPVNLISLLLFLASLSRQVLVNGSEYYSRRSGRKAIGISQLLQTENCTAIISESSGWDTIFARLLDSKWLVYAIASMIALNMYC
jgi:hypothetical protein